MFFFWEDSRIKKCNSPSYSKLMHYIIQMQSKSNLRRKVAIDSKNHQKVKMRLAKIFVYKRTKAIEWFSYKMSNHITNGP